MNLHEGEATAEVNHHSRKNAIPRDNNQDGGNFLDRLHSGNESTYQLLSGANDACIRLLILEPGADDDALVGRLEVISLAQAHRSFEAISYVWGSHTKNQIITVSGENIAITISLRDSLRQTRRPDQPRALWADSICINQEDDKEKGHQVSLMGQIYKASRCTLICLGDSKDDKNHFWTQVAQDLAALIAEVEEMMDRVMGDPNFSMDWDSFPWPKADDPLLAPEKWRSWSYLIKQPWFQRGWVVQEAALGPDCRVLWAGVEIPWISILRVYHWLGYRGPNLLSVAGMRQAIPWLHVGTYTLQRQNEARTLVPSPRQSSRLGDMSTLRTLDSARGLQVKDPKDRIYAFMALPTSDAAMPDLQPNYGEETSHLDVYRDFAVKYLERNSNLDILSYVVHYGDDSLARSVDSISPLGRVCSSTSVFPSWIPRWDRITPVATDIIFNRNSRKLNHESQEITLLDNYCTLRVKAVIFDSIEFVSEVIYEYQSKDNQGAVASVVSIWREIAQHSIKYPGPHKNRLSLAFIDMLCLGRHEGDAHQWIRAREAFANLLQSDDPTVSMDVYEKDWNARYIAGNAMNWSNKNRFLILARGYYGSSSGATREGDVCAVIFGTRSPFVLRKLDAEKHCYALIGPAFVHCAAVNDKFGGTPYGMSHGERYDDWKNWDLPTKDILLC